MNARPKIGERKRRKKTMALPQNKTKQNKTKVITDEC
jgi:hypothetical protein